MAERDLLQARGGGLPELRVVAERGVVEGEAALGFGDAERDGRERLRHRAQVFPVVGAAPPLVPLRTATTPPTRGARSRYFNLRECDFAVSLGLGGLQVGPPQSVVFE